MADTTNLFRLLQCNDSAFPSGAFAFSNGLESLVLEQMVKGQADESGIQVAIHTDTLNPLGLMIYYTFSQFVS